MKTLHDLKLFAEYSEAIRSSDEARLGGLIQFVLNQKNKLIVF